MSGRQETWMEVRRRAEVAEERLRMATDALEAIVDTPPMPKTMRTVAELALTQIKGENDGQ